MTPNRLFELIDGANTVPNPGRLLPNPADVEALFAEITHRAGSPILSESLPDAVANQGHDGRIGVQLNPPVEIADIASRHRRLRIAIVGASFLLVAMLAAIPLWRNIQVVGEAPLTPLEVVEALNQAIVAGDWSAERQLFADDALFTDVGQSSQVRFSEPIQDVNVSDWDGDGVVTLFDDLLQSSATDYAAGVTVPYACTQTDSTTVECDEVALGHAFVLDAERTNPRTTSRYTVVGGKIVHQELVDTAFPSMDANLDPLLLRDYRVWVIVNLIGEESSLFLGLGDLPDMNPETVERHRELIAQWRAQRPGSAVRTPLPPGSEQLTMDVRIIEGTKGTFSVVGDSAICDQGGLTNSSFVRTDVVWTWVDEYTCSDGSGSFLLSGKFDLDPAVPNPPSLDGTWSISSGTGAYGTLRGTGTVSSTFSPFFKEIYTGELQY